MDSLNIEICYKQAKLYYKIFITLTAKVPWEFSIDEEPGFKIDRNKSTFGRDSICSDPVNRKIKESELKF